MARKQHDVWDAKPSKSVRYGPFDRFADWRRGCSDGKNGRPQLPPVPPQDLATRLTTPYIARLRNGFWSAAEAENQRALRDVQHYVTKSHELDALAQQHLDRSNACQKELESLPETLPESLLSLRNAAEQHADDTLIRTRRWREHTAARDKVKAAKLRADEARNQCLAELAGVKGAIAMRRHALHVRVRMLHAHTLMRRDAYLGHLTNHHPDGAALIGYFSLSTVDLPGWLDYWPDDQGGTRP